MKVSLHEPSFFHLVHPGRNLLRKHSSHSDDFKLGRVLSNNRKLDDAKVRMSIQFCRGTVE